MARRKEKVSAYGRMWGQEDVKTLEKLIKLYERLNYLQDHFAGSLSGASAIWSQINEKTDIQNELKEMGIKLNEEEAKKVIYLIQQQAELNKSLDKKNELLSASDALSVANKNYAANGRDNATSWGSVRGNLGNTIASTFQQRNANKVQTEMFKELAIAYKNAGKDLSSEDFTNRLNQNVTTKLESSAGKYSKAAGIIQTAVNIFSDAVKTWVSVARKGLENQTNAYEQTFEGISVRTGLTRGQYYGMQSNTNNILGELGLRNNIATSDVQQMWSTLTKQGINIDKDRDKYIADAIETVLTNKIVPYLDTSNAYYQQLMTIEPTFNKQIRGINLAANELLGSSVVITNHLQDMVTNMSPMAALAEQELGVQYAKSLGTYEAMRQAGYSDYEIGQYMSTAESVYRDPYAALTSDKLDKNLAAVYALSGGGDLRDFSYMNENFLKAEGLVTSLNPGGNWAPLFAGALGVSSLDVMAQVGAKDRNLKGNVSQYLSMGDILAGNLGAYSNLATNNYKGDVNQTNKQLQDITLENLMNELSVINEWLGNWATFISNTIKTIGGLILGKMVLGGIGKLFGSGGSLLSGSGGIAGALTSFAGTTLGYQAMGIGASMGINSVPLATAAGLALPAGIAAGGIAGGAYGIHQGVKDWQNGNKVRGGISAAGGAAMAAGGLGVAGGMLAAGAANAWNPVGWGLLIAGGLAVAGTAIARATDTTVDLSQELAAEKDAAVRGIKESNEKTIDNMYQVREAIKQATSYEEAKNIALQSGIVKQKDLNDATEKSVDALLHLADVSIEDQKNLNMISEQTVSAYEDIKGAIKESAGNSLLSVVNTAEAGGRGYNDLSEDEKQQINQFMQAYIKYAKETGLAESDKDVKWRIEQWGSHFDDDIFSKEDFDKVFNGNNATSRALFESFVASDQGAKILSGKSALSSLYGEDNYYSTMASDTVSQYILSALTADTASSAQSYLKVLKSYGLTWDKLPEAAKLKLTENFGEDIGSYRQGLDYVPYDNYLANLHEGESVLTASTANELRNLVVEYRETNTRAVNFEAIIQSQTVDLITKLDEVISAIRNNVSPFSDTGFSTPSKLDNMLSFKSSKAFI